MNIYDYLPILTLHNAIPPYGFPKIKTYRVQITNPGKYRWRAYYHIDMNNELVAKINYDKNKLKPIVDKVYTQSTYGDSFYK